MKETDTQRLTVKLPPAEIVFVDMVFKSYEGLAMLNVDHDREGIIYLDVTAGTRPDVLDILEDFRKNISLKIVDK